MKPLKFEVQLFNIFLRACNSILIFVSLAVLAGQAAAASKGVPEPCAPALALTTTAMSATMSGKQPVPDVVHMDESRVANGGGKQQARSPDAKAATRLQRIVARQWRMAFHPSFSIVGVQPSVMVPQVRGRAMFKISGWRAWAADSMIWLVYHCQVDIMRTIMAA